MARQGGWHGLAKMAWPWGSEEAESTPKAGLVIAGGGARASFEIGALRYLYEHTDFTAEVICGTSAGSMLAATIGQYAGHDDQLAAIRAFETAWRSMSSSEDMFAPREWFARLQALLPELQTLVPAVQTPVNDDDVVEEERRNTWFRLPQLEFPTWAGRRREVTPEDNSDITEPGPDQHFHPLLGFAPEPEGDHGHGWTPTALWSILNALPGLGRFSSDLPKILRGAELTRAMYRPGAILRTLLSDEFFSPERLAHSGVETRLAMTCVETGQLRYITGTGVLVDRDNQPVPHEEPQDIVMGLLASCSIPAVFAPVPLGKSHYLDGGIRENCPAEMAIGHLGATQPWVIIASPAGLAPDPQAAQGTIIDLVFRCTMIQSDETQRDEIEYAQSAGAKVIDPEVDVHDTRTVDPGLIDINIAYGWMRGQDVVESLPDTEVALHRTITQMRRRCWQVEERLYGPTAVSDSGETELALTELISAKFSLRDAVAACQWPLPEGAQQWWCQYEQHQFEIDRPPSWATMV
ncbi:MAG: patatin-like phospholipase family protein [Propionibacteriaceae bacterium]